MRFNNGFKNKDAGRSFYIAGQFASGNSFLRRHFSRCRTYIIYKTQNAADAHIFFARCTKQREDIVPDHGGMHTGFHFFFGKFTLVKIFFHQVFIVRCDGFNQCFVKLISSFFFAIRNRHFFGLPPIRAKFIHDHGEYINDAVKACTGLHRVLHSHHIFAEMIFCITQGTVKICFIPV